MPAISVIMPVYNSAPFLREAIDSILNQTFTNFELIILDDGSTDGSKDIITSYTDTRIIFHDNGQNIGLPKTQNKGIQLSTGKYIARMDSDDIALPDRLQKQFDFMEAQTDVAVCGGFFDFIGRQDTLFNVNWVTQTDPDLVKINLLFDCAICQPTAMMRASVLRDNGISYNEAYEVSEDYELWVALSRRFKIANLGESVLQYRISNIQISGKRNELQISNKFKLIKNQLLELGVQPDNSELRIHFYMFFSAVILSYDYIPKLKKWIAKLVAANKTHSIYNAPKLDSYLNEMLQANIQAFNRALAAASPKQKLIYRLKSLLKWQSIR